MDNFLEDLLRPLLTSRLNSRVNNLYCKLHERDRSPVGPNSHLRGRSRQGSSIFAGLVTGAKTGLPTAVAGA